MNPPRSVAADLASARPAIRLLAALLAVLSLSACSGRIPGVYRIDIQQGNVLTQSQLAQLEAGMEKRKVRFVLGTPLVTDTFNQDRWDYYYSYEQGNGDKVQRIVSVYFEDERLVRVGGNVKAARGRIAVAPRPDELVKVPEGLIDDGLLAALTPSFWSDRPRRIKPKKERQEAEQTESETPPAAEPTDAPEIVLSEAETRELTDVLSEFGRRDARLDEGESAATDSEQGIISRFARGLKPPSGDDQDLSGGN